MLNVEQACGWLKGSQSISVQEGKLTLDERMVRLRRWLDSDFDAAQIQNLVASIFSAHEETSDEKEKEGLRRLGDLCVTRHGSNQKVAKILKALDREFFPFRETQQYLHPAIKADLARWRRYGFREDIFLRFPKFVKWFLASPVASQMKVTRDDVGIVGDEPAIMVEGEWIPFSSFKERFLVEDAPGFQERFLVDDHNRQVYTYLDNGLGIQEHHPYLDMMPIPISTLTAEEYDRTLAVARKFVRTEEAELTEEELEVANEDRAFVLQIVSSFVDGRDFNANTFLQRRKHPWIRIIIGEDNERVGTKKGEVYEVGFGWEKKVWAPSMTTRGRFRAQDLWNYKTPAQRVVTNIPISKSEASGVFHFGLRYHADSINLGRRIGFHLAHQNCSVFVRYAADAANIEVPTEASVTEVIARVAPDWMRAVGSACGEAKDAVCSGFRHVGAWIPSPVDSVVAEPVRECRCLASELIHRVGALFLGLGRLATGGACGNRGRAFVHAGEEEREITPPARNPFRLLNFSDYRINLPSILQEWQLEQPSTVIYPKPVKLSIVPPMEEVEADMVGAQ